MLYPLPFVPSCPVVSGDYFSLALFAHGAGSQRHVGFEYFDPTTRRIDAKWSHVVDVLEADVMSRPAHDVVR